MVSNGKSSADSTPVSTAPVSSMAGSAFAPDPERIQTELIRRLNQQQVGVTPHVYQGGKGAKPGQIPGCRASAEMEAMFNATLQLYRAYCPTASDLTRWMVAMVFGAMEAAGVDPLMQTLQTTELMNNSWSLEEGARIAVMEGVRDAGEKVGYYRDQGDTEAGWHVAKGFISNVTKEQDAVHLRRYLRAIRDNRNLQWAMVEGQRTSDPLVAQLQQLNTLHGI